MGIGLGLGSIIGSGLQMIGQNQAQKHDERLAADQRRYNTSMWRSQNAEDDRRWNRQNDYNLEMWHMQNQYNSPQEQMARMKAAGLNPHLMYGKGSVGQAGQVPTTNVGSAHDAKGYTRAQARNVMQGQNAFRDFVQFKHTQAQDDNLQAQTDLTNRS